MSCHVHIVTVVHATTVVPSSQSQLSRPNLFEAHLSMPLQTPGKNLNDIRTNILLDALTNIAIEQVSAQALKPYHSFFWYTHPFERSKEPSTLRKNLALQDALSSFTSVAPNPVLIDSDAFDHEKGVPDSVPILQGGITELDLKHFTEPYACNIVTITLSLRFMMALFLTNIPAGYSDAQIPRRRAGFHNSFHCRFFEWGG